MAHIALTVDRDRERRRRFITTARDRIAALGGLVIEQAECDDLAVVWGLFAHAPHSLQVSPHELALVVGDAIGDDGRRWGARDLATMVTDDEHYLPTGDGFYIAIRYDVRGSLRIGSDPLGMFPLYYGAVEDVIVAASSCYLCGAHPLVSVEPDIAGMAGILLANGLVANRPLNNGCRRLAAGCQLHWIRPRAHGQSAARELEAYRLPVHDRYLSATFEQACELLNDRLADAVRRHQPHGSTSTLMLSGGLDSRMLAGYLAQQSVTRSAVVLGRDTDLEMCAARQVAGVLGFSVEREQREPTEEDFLTAAFRAACWEQLAGGFSGFEMDAAASCVGQIAPWSWAGYAGDLVLGGSAVRCSWDPTLGRNTFEQYVRKTNEWGVPADRLERLLGRGDGGEIVASRIEELRKQWQCEEESAEQRTLRMRLHSRIRYHIGTLVHRLSQCSWPLLPLIDRGVLDVVFNLPPRYLRDRQMQYAITGSRFPQLAMVAQDTNSFLFEPARRIGLRKKSALVRWSTSLRRRCRQWYWKSWRGIEPRRYHRFYDPDGPYWRCIRSIAESHRPRLGQWLSPTELDVLWPAPGVRVRAADPFTEAAALRLLLGLGLALGGRT